MTRFLDEFDSEPEYMPYPKFLKKSALTHPARMIYMMLLDRYTLSRKNNWRDAEGHIYIVYPISHLAEDSGMSETAVRRAVEELKRTDYIISKRHGFSSPNRIYLKVPDGAKMTGTASERHNSKIHFENERTGGWDDWIELHQEKRSAQPEPAVRPETDTVQECTQCTDKHNDCPDTHTVQICTQCADEHSVEPETDTMTVQRGTLSPPADEHSVRPETDTQYARERTPNNININNINLNNTISNNKRAYGTHGNVLLTEEDYSRIQTEHPEEFDTMLAFLSEFLHDSPFFAQDPANSDHAECLMRLFG